MKIGLALSGGAARGIAHIGVLRYLEEREIKPFCIAGTSAGSIVGAFYASGMSLDEISAAVAAMTWRNLVKLTIPRKGLINSLRLLKMLEEHLGKNTFDQLSIPLIVNAVDIVTGEEVLMEEGIVSKAVVASCAIPGIFTPVKRGGRWLVDGGLLVNLPVDIVRSKGADFVIAVNVGSQKPLKEVPGTIFEIIIQSYHIIRRQLEEPVYNKCDILIEPQLGDISYFDNSQMDRLIEIGYSAARVALEGVNLKKRPGIISSWLAKRARIYERRIQ